MVLAARAIPPSPSFFGPRRLGVCSSPASREGNVTWSGALIGNCPDSPSANEQAKWPQQRKVRNPEWEGGPGAERGSV